MRLIGRKSLRSVPECQGRFWERGGAEEMATTEENQSNRDNVGDVEEHDRARENGVEGTRGAEV